MKTYTYTDDHRKYLDMIMQLNDDQKITLTDVQVEAIRTIKKYQQYGPYEKGILNSIKYTYKLYLGKINEGA